MLRCVLFALLTIPTTIEAAIEEAVVRVGDCSGVCVDPLGLVLSVRHCDLPENVIVEFPRRRVPARRCYQCPETEGPVVYRCQGTGFPSLPLAETVPPRGALVRSFGYPLVDSNRRLQSASGILLGGGKFQFHEGEFRGNVTSFRTHPGWSGGPLVNAAGEVCGLLTGSDCGTSVFVSFAATKAAVDSARASLRNNTKPTLYIFGSTRCGPCQRFRRDYGVDSPLKRQLNAAFDVIFVDVDREAEVARHFDVGEVPTFLVEGRRPIHGYESAEDLLAQILPVSEPDPEWIAESPGPQAAETRDKNDPQPAVTAEEPFARTSNDRLEDVMDRFASATRIATWLGVTGATGGVGALALTGLAWWLRHRRERRGNSRDPPTAGPTGGSVESVAAPRTIVPETRFAPYERNSFAEAFAWAEAELVRKYPGAVGTLESLRGLIDQYLAGQRTRGSHSASSTRNAP